MHQSLQTVVRAFSRLSFTPEPPAPRVQIRTVSPARFILDVADPRTRFGSRIELTLSFSCMRTEHCNHTVEVRIADHGLDIQSVVEVNESRVLIYLGNHFVVPEDLRRVGLATACIAAIRQAAQVAVFGQVQPNQRMVLEGFFVGDGQGWARAMCDGRLPAKGFPAEVDLDRLQAQVERLTLLEPPATRLYSAAA